MYWHCYEERHEKVGANSPRPFLLLQHPTHPFPKGNDRHARLAADFLIDRLGRERFSSGGGTLRDVGELRTRYVADLRVA